MTPQRVVSLVPSVTETLFELGVGGTVVGITDYCIFPPGLDLPRIGGTKNPAVDKIRALRPDLVHMNLEENLERHARQIGDFTRIFLTHPSSVGGAREMVEQLGRIHGAEARADAIVARIDEELAALKANAKPFTFAVPIWRNPWMWCGSDTYVSGLVTAAGGINVVKALRYPPLDVAAIAAHAPDVIFLPDEPYAFTEADAAALSQLGSRIVGPFPGHLFTWHGSRTIEGLRFLRQTSRASEGPPATPSSPPVR